MLSRVLYFFKKQFRSNKLFSVRVRRGMKKHICIVIGPNILIG